VLDELEREVGQSEYDAGRRHPGGVGAGLEPHEAGEHAADAEGEQRAT
jgi:hypothetical protein